MDKAFLTGRKQQLALDGCYSEWLDVISCIPQGSVLSPVLFLIYLWGHSKNDRTEGW